MTQKERHACLVTRHDQGKVPTAMGPQGDHHVGTPSCTRKLAQEIGGQVGISMLFNTANLGQVLPDDQADQDEWDAHYPGQSLACSLM